MSISAYFQKFRQILTSSLFITSQSITTEERPPSAGLIRGTLTFTDGSQLQFKEFIIYKNSIHIQKYSYHYVRSNQMVFRYDNALDPAARHLSTYPHHKHIAEGIIASEHPSLSDILHEISFYITR